MGTDGKYNIRTFKRHDFEAGEWQNIECSVYCNDYTTMRETLYSLLVDNPTIVATLYINEIDAGWQAYDDYVWNEERQRFYLYGKE